MSSALATPCSTMRAASFMTSACSRGTMNPGAAAQTTGTLPAFSSRVFMPSRTCGAVPGCGLTSTSGTIYAGLSQWAFSRRSGWTISEASSVTRMVEVVDATVACGFAWRPMNAKASRLASSTSGTPSNTVSAAASAQAASLRPTNRTRSRMDWTASGPNMPSPASVDRVAPISTRLSCRSCASACGSRSLMSTSATSWPA